MKFFLRDAAIFAVLAAGASAAGSGLFAASGVELEAYKRSDGGLTYGEPVSIPGTINRSVKESLTTSSKAWSWYITRHPRCDEE